MVENVYIGAVCRCLWGLWPSVGIVDIGGDCGGKCRMLTSVRIVEHGGNRGREWWLWTMMEICGLRQRLWTSVEIVTLWRLWTLVGIVNDAAEYWSGYMNTWMSTEPGDCEYWWGLKRGLWAWWRELCSMVRDGEAVYCVRGKSWKRRIAYVDHIPLKNGGESSRLKAATKPKLLRN